MIKEGHKSFPSGHSWRLHLVCAVLINSNILTVNYSVKQNQFTKLTSEPRASDPEESTEVFGLEDGTVALLYQIID